MEETKDISLESQSSQPPKNWRGISIGGKFTVLITGLLGITLIAFLLNAAQLFKKDNLDSIYLFTDIFNSSKAGEVKEWFEGTFSRLRWISSTLGSSQQLDQKITKDILLINKLSYLRKKEGIQLEAQRHSWTNSKLKDSVSGGLEQFQVKLEKEIQGLAQIKAMYSPSLSDWAWVKAIRTSSVSEVSSSGFMIIFPTIEAQDKLEIVGAVLNDTELANSFSGTGPYSILLLDYDGTYVTGSELKQDINVGNPAELPFVRTMLTSKLDREFQEFEYKNVKFLGAYQKLGLANLAVMSLVPKNIALESGGVLIRRTVLIGSLLFLAAFIFTYLFVERLVYPILQLRSATRKVSQGNFSTRVSVQTRDEIHDLAMSFNSMSEEIERRIRNLYRINDASGRIRSTKNIQELLDYATEFSRSLLNCKYGLGLYFGTKKEIQLGKSKGVYSNRSWKPDSDLKAIVHQMGNSKEIVQCKVGEECYLVLPVLYRQNVKGVIVLGGRQPKKEFQPEDIFMARTVLAMVSADSENLQYQEELRELNADLENRVRLRTAELAEANEHLKETTALTLKQKKELDDVMNNIQQGILTLDSTGRINPDFSKYAIELFGKEEIADANITDLLFGSKEKEQLGPELIMWLESIFNSPESFDMIKDFGIKDLEYSKPIGEGEQEIRQIHFEWKPIYQENQIIKMMLVCFDLTEQKRLEAEIKRQEESHKEELEIIAQLVNNAQSVVEQFISDFNRNLVEGNEIFANEDSGRDAESGRSLFRVLHTLKGSIKQFGLKSVQERAHKLEDRVGLYYKALAKGDPSPTEFDGIRDEFKQIEDSLNRMMEVYHKIMSSKSSSGTGASADGKSRISISEEKFDVLLTQVFQGPGEVSKATAKKFLESLLLVPVDELFERLDKLAKSLSEELGYQVKIVRRGGSTPVDMRAIPKLYDALLHVIRNSLDHAGEPPEVREQKGKPPALTIEMIAALEEGKVKISIVDDGKGIDRKAVLKRAVSSGIVKQENAKQLTDAQVIDLIFLPGFSTKEEVTDLSGRGVGMDVVKQTIEEVLGGKIQMTSQLGKGSRLDIRLQSQVLKSKSQAQPVKKAA